MEVLQRRRNIESYRGRLLRKMTFANTIIIKKQQCQISIHWEYMILYHILLYPSIYYLVSLWCTFPSHGPPRLSVPGGGGIICYAFNISSRCKASGTKSKTFPDKKHTRGAEWGKDEWQRYLPVLLVCWSSDCVKPFSHQLLSLQGRLQLQTIESCWFHLQSHEYNKKIIIEYQNEIRASMWASFHFPSPHDSSEIEMLRLLRSWRNWQFSSSNLMMLSDCCSFSWWGEGRGKKKDKNLDVTTDPESKRTLIRTWCSSTTSFLIAWRKSLGFDDSLTAFIAWRSCLLKY